ncbi:MAG: ABC transporter permease [Actinomycetota bacterium]|nr:ABC transporter permease [Actinomycetota bacterium]
MSVIKSKNKNLIYPGLLWLFIFFLLPLSVILIYAVTAHDLVPGESLKFTFSNFAVIFQKKHYLIILLRSLKISFLTTIFSIIFSYPVAYFLAKRTKFDKVLIVVLMIPFWINYLIRTFAWKLILSENGVLNQLLLWLKVIDEPVRVLYSQTSVLLGLIYMYTPMMVLPLYASLLRIDNSLVEASQDLGASRIRAFFDITFKLSLTGIFAGTLLVFIPALGSFAIPAILGGTDSVMIGNIIENQFSRVGNWNFGSAFTVALAVLSIALVLFYSKIFGLESIYKNKGNT